VIADHEAGDRCAGDGWPLAGSTRSSVAAGSDYVLNGCVGGDVRPRRCHLRSCAAHVRTRQKNGSHMSASVFVRPVACGRRLIRGTGRCTSAVTAALDLKCQGRCQLRLGPVWNRHRWTSISAAPAYDERPDGADDHAVQYDAHGGGLRSAIACEEPLEVAGTRTERPRLRFDHPVARRAPGDDWLIEDSTNLSLPPLIDCSTTVPVPAT